MRRHYAVTVVGEDRPGIIAGITKVLFEHGCNLEDSTSTILRGHFSMMLIVSGGDDDGGLEAALQDAATALEVAVVLSEVGDHVADPEPPTHIVSVYGADKPGIVHGITSALAASRINVTDMTSRVIGEDAEPVYAVMLEVAAEDDGVLEDVLQSAAGDLGVDVSVHPIETDIL